MRGFLVVILMSASCVSTQDWPMFGRDSTRNAVSPEKDPPTDWSIKAGDERNIAWMAKVGRMSFGCPVVSDGLVWIGTNNEVPRDPAAKGDGSVLMCFRAQDGKFLWQHVTPRNPEYDRHGEWGSYPLRSTPLVQGDRLWFMNNRWEVICLDIGPLKRDGNAAVELWRTDLIAKAGIWPQVLGMGYGPTISMVILDGRLYLPTTTGIEWRGQRMSRPEAPALICLDARTGSVLGRERSGIAARTPLANWSSPSLARVQDRTLLLFGGGDGFLYAFDPVPSESGTLREIWKVDCRPPGQEPLGIVASPVVHQGRVYVTVGLDSDSTGDGRLSCVDAATGRLLWNFKELGTSMSNVVVMDGLVVAIAQLGIIYGLESSTGRKMWEYDCLSVTTTSPTLVDGRVYLTNGDDEVLTLDLRVPGQKPRVQKREMAGCSLATPSFSSGTLYVAGGCHLYAIRQGQAGAPLPSDPAAKRGRSPGALYLPTPPDIVDSMLNLAKAKETDLVYDLGSGDGRIVLSAARRYKCRAVGVEIDPTLVEESRKLIKEGKCEERVRIVHEDLLKADFSDATVVTLYVGDQLNRLLMPKLEALKPGTRIVTHRFPLPGVKPVEVVKRNSREDGLEHELFLYTVPAEKK